MTDFPAAQTTPRRVLILQRILPPYRLAFFQALSRSPLLAVTLACGQASKSNALESVPHPPGVRTRSLTNAYFGKNEQIIVQLGSLSLLASGRYDTVIAEFNPRILTNVLACLSARLRGLKFLWWGHGYRPKSGRFDKWVYRRLAGLADALIFYSASGAEELTQQGLPREKTFVAWNSINLEEIESLIQPTATENRTRILYIGRLIAEKKTALLLRAFARAAAQLDPKTTLTIIGDGPERDHLIALAESLGVAGRVEFVGSLYEQAKLAPYFNTAWVSVSPGYVGLSAVHSLAYGIPMLVADKEPHSPEIAAIEDEVNAVFFSSNGPEALSKAMTDLAGDPAKQKRLSVAAHRGVRQHFSIEGMVQAFEAAVRYAHR